MSSVICEIDCKRCGWSQADYMRNVRTYEEWALCRRCGWLVESRIVRWNGPTPEYEFTERGGEGAFKVASANGSFSTGTLEAQDRPAFVEETKSLLEHRKIASAEYTFTRDGQWFVHDVGTDQDLMFTAELVGGE